MEEKNGERNQLRMNPMDVTAKLTVSPGFASQR
jgi:hypothetical protein